MSADPAAGAHAISEPRGKVWVGVVIAFLAANIAQVLFCVAPRILGFGNYPVSPGWYNVAILSYVFAPALTATFFSLIRLTRLHRTTGRARSVGAVLIVLVLAIASALLGVFIAFNLWGT